MYVKDSYSLTLRIVQTERPFLPDGQRGQKEDRKEANAVITNCRGIVAALGQLLYESTE